MTPFMMRVAEIVESDEFDDFEMPMPMTVPSVRQPINSGNDRQVALRGYAEQLVCEVNAVLADEDDHMSLVDEVVGNELVFSVAYRGRVARISTEFSSGTAYGRIVADGLNFDEPHELTGPLALEDLLILLLVESDVPRHPVF